MTPTRPESSLHRWLAPAATPERLAYVRIVVLGFACVWLGVMAPDIIARAQLHESRFAAVGLATATGRVDPVLLAPMVALGLGVGVLALLGVRYRITAPLFAATLWWLLSYRNSWGHLSHSEHLLVLHVAVLAVSPAADALRVGHAGRRLDPTPHPAYGWPLRLLMLVTVSTYVVAGLAKIGTGGTAWLSGEAVRLHVGTEVLRNLRVGLAPARVGQWLLGWPPAFGVLAIGTVVLELGAPLALLRRVGPIPLGRLWIVGLWLMHFGIWLVMGIGFPYPLSGVAFAAWLPLDRIVARIRS